MKKKMFLLCYSILCFFLTNAQENQQMLQIAIHSQNESLDSVLRQLARAREYDFIYQDTIISNTAIVNQKLMEITISQILDGIPTLKILDELLENSNYRYFLVFNRQVIIYKKNNRLSQNAESQNIIKGKVVNENGDPISGAAINVYKSTTTIGYSPPLHRGVISGGFTDSNGNFEISIPNPDVFFIVTYIGYPPRLIQNNEDDVGVIKMVPDMEALNEVVVTGLW